MTVRILAPLLGDPSTPVMVDEAKSVIPLTLFCKRLRKDIGHLFQRVHIDHVEMFGLKLLSEPSKADILGSVGVAHLFTITLGNYRDGGLVVLQDNDLELIAKPNSQTLDVCHRPSAWAATVPNFVKFRVNPCEDAINLHRRGNFRPNLVVGWINLNLFPKEHPKAQAGKTLCSNPMIGTDNLTLGARHRDAGLLLGECVQGVISVWSDKVKGAPGG